MSGRELYVKSAVVLAVAIGASVSAKQTSLQTKFDLYHMNGTSVKHEILMLPMGS